MVKQTKKGSIGKKALSAILAASMIMTSSSFVMAGPVVEEVEAVAVEEAAAVDAEQADVVEEVETEDELVGVALKDVKVSFGADAYSAPMTKEEAKNATAVATYNGSALEPIVGVKATDVTPGSSETEISPLNYTITYANNIDAGIGSYTITFKNGYTASTVTGYFKIGQMNLTTTNTTVNYATDRGYVYDGTEKFPTVNSVTVTSGTKVLTLDPADYELVAATANGVGGNITDGKYNLTGAGTQKVKLSVKNDNYNIANGVGDKYFNIQASPFNKSTVEVTPTSVAYTGNAVDAAPIVKNAITGVEIKKGENVAGGEYTIQYYDKDGRKADGPQTDMGTYRIDIVGNAGGNYGEGTISSTYTITKGSLALAESDVVLTGSGVDKDDKTGEWYLTYTGSEQSITAVSFSGNAIPSTEYTCDLENAKGTDVGTFNIVIEGKNSFAGETLTIPVVIRPRQIKTEGYDISAQVGKTSDGKASSNAVVSIKDNNRADDPNTTEDDTVLVEGKDYTYTVDTAKKEVVITGVGNYTTVDAETKATTLDVEYDEPNAVLMADPIITGVVNGTYSYTGKQITPAVEDIVVKEGDIVLKADKDYTITYGKNIESGEGTVIITGTGNGNDGGYSGKKELTFKISGTAFDSMYRVMPMDDIHKTDITAVTKLPRPEVKYLNNTASAPVKDYEVVYSRDGKKLATIKDGGEIELVTGVQLPDVQKVGTIDVEVKGLGEFEGSIKTSFNVLGTDISKADVEAIEDQEYTGKAIEPAVVVMLNIDSDPEKEELVNGQDYVVTYENNVKVGSARAIITGKGEFSGKIIVPFNIVGEMEQEISVLPAQEKALKSRTLNDKATKVKFTKDLETAVTYTSSDEDVVTVDAEGNIKYTGLGEATITIKTAAENGYKEAVKELKVVVGLKQPTFSPSSKNNAFTVTTSTVKGAEKFQVQYVPTGKSFTSKAAKSKTFTVDKKLVKGRISAANKETYRVRVRAINGDTKSKWSPVKTIATK